LSSRSVGSKGFQVSGVAKRAKGAWTSFYSPQKESSHWGVRDPNMSGLEARHVCQTSLEPGLATGHVQCWDLAWVISERLDMSGLGGRYVRRTLLEPDDPAG
jgi:hypothetical protein